MPQATGLAKVAEDDKILLSNYALALISELGSLPKNPRVSYSSALTVSQTVSFFAILYEKIRNAVEFREEHLVRRAAIERILNRRLSLNPKGEGEGEGENLARELMWARYITADSISDSEIAKLQVIIDKYYLLRQKALLGRNDRTKHYINEFLYDFLTCELEEALNPSLTKKKAAYLYFFYQVMKRKVAIRGVSQEIADSYFYVAAEIAMAKSDRAYLRYHLFTLLIAPVHQLTEAQIDTLSKRFVGIINTINQTIHNQFSEKLVKFAKKQTAPFLILFEIANQYPQQFEIIIASVSKLKTAVAAICQQKYAQTGAKLRIAAIRSIVYIFLTKAVFALILEYPLSKYLYAQVHIVPIAINAIFPPILMGLIVSFVHVPDDENTQRIFGRTIDIVNSDQSFETGRSLIASKSRVKRPLLVFGFTVLYLLTFGITFMSIFFILDLMKFNIISKGVFVFFISLVVFFGYRVRQTAKEYSLSEKRGILSPLADFFFLPILFVGKQLSQEIAKLNVLILIFDFLIEAPFKVIAEIVEEWISFMKARKDEIV